MKDRFILTIILSGILAKGVSAQVKKDSLQKSNSSVVEKVVESTFKNYPQQAGQPTITHQQYYRPTRLQTRTGSSSGKTSPAISESKDYEEYQTWLREKRSKQETGIADVNPASNTSNLSNAKSDKKKPTFQQKFAERPVRNSGIWAIPVVGVHASAFDSDVKKDNTSGRTGWNAGLDVRIRAKRFFCATRITLSEFFNGHYE